MRTAADPYITARRSCKPTSTLRIIWFHEYFDGYDGRGLGASHQTGWTGLIANLIDELYSTNR
jgi:hypothetical protein